MIILGTLLLYLYDLIVNKINELFFPELYNMKCDAEYTEDIKMAVQNCNPLKIVSYNVHNFYNIIWLNKRTKILNYLKECNADVVCLQECKDNIYEELKGTYRNYIQVGEQVILTRHNIVDIDTFIHPVIKNRKHIKTPIIRLELHIDNEKVEVTIANIHFSSDITFYEQQKNLKELLTLTNTLENKNKLLILIGDTNLSVIKDLPYNVLTYNTHNTFPTIMPVLALDRVFYRNLILQRCIVDKSISASDHYPLVSEFVLK
jgi:endonuclease/exonuclease/phosphatase family metal-dependent hydrolase